MVIFSHTLLNTVHNFIHSETILFDGKYVDFFVVKIFLFWIIWNALCDLVSVTIWRLYDRWNV